MRSLLIKRITNNVEQIKVTFGNLTKQMKTIHDEEDFDETNLHQFENEVAQLTAQLKNPSEIPIDVNYSSSTINIFTNASGNVVQCILVI